MKIFLTGHTGFKGTWLSRLLVMEGHQVTGYGLAPESEFFALSGVEADMHSIIGDVRDGERLARAMQEAAPEVVIHMAAQPLVRDSYARPVYTYETNVMGTVNLLEAVRHCGSVRSVVNVTTDKVYDNLESDRGYREDDRLDGYDPYSNSKSCSELVTHAYRRSFLDAAGIAVSTVRAGNVIGGGDFARDRILPDCVRAAVKGEEIVLRSPGAVRPFQFVLEPLCIYRELALRQMEDASLADCWNVGPDRSDCITVAELTDIFCQTWGGVSWRSEVQEGPHEAGLLMLDCSKLKARLGWRPTYDIRQAVAASADWYRTWAEGGDMKRKTEEQIRTFLEMRPEGTR